jgi:kynurenine formamidase
VDDTADYWGRWGADDQRGALNLLGEHTVLRGIGTVRAGKTVSLAVPMGHGKGPIFANRAPLQHFMARDGGDYAAGLPEKGFGMADDYIVLATQGTTHIDALAHVWKDGVMWNGYSANSVTSRGASQCGIENVGPVVTRAIFLDFADDYARSGNDRHGIEPWDLENALAATGETPMSGDALIIRTGWLKAWRAGEAAVTAWPGLTPACAAWVVEHDFALVGADNMAVELGPAPDPNDAAPLHIKLIRDRGIYFVELLDLEGLADAGRTSFCLAFAPMPLVGGVGSPLHPFAIY